MNNAWTDEKIIKLLRSRLDDYRFNHSLNVADSAKELAEIYGADPKKCYTAGLLHDVMKNASDEEHEELFKMAGITLSRDEKNNRKLWQDISNCRIGLRCLAPLFPTT